MERANYSTFENNCLRPFFVPRIRFKLFLGLGRYHNAALRASRSTLRGQWPVPTTLGSMDASMADPRFAADSLEVRGRAVVATLSPPVILGIAALVAALLCCRTLPPEYRAEVTALREGGEL